MDVARFHEVGLKQAIRHLEQLIIQGTELINPLNNEFKLILLQLGNLLKREIRTSIWQRRTTKAGILESLGKELEQHPPANNVSSMGRLARLRRTFRSLTVIMGNTYTALHRRKNQISNLSRKLAELKEMQNRSEVRLAIEGIMQDEAFQELQDFDTGNLVPANEVKEVLPLEVWKMILDQVDKPKDKMSVANAKKAFWELQKDKRTNWMFELVLPHLAKQLTKADILNCRQICKSWCKGVDEHLQSQHSLDGGKDSKKVFTQIKGVHELCRFNREMNSQSGRNPFPSGALSLDASTFRNGPVASYFRGMIGWSGDHLSSLSYTCQQWSIDAEEDDDDLDNTSPQTLFYYFTLRDLLSSTPNLRRLSLTGSIDECDARGLSDTVINFPLPALPKLESLSIEFNPDENLCKWMLTAYSQHLTELSLAEATSVQQWRESVPPADLGQPFPFPNLKMLHVKSVEGHRNLSALLNLVEAPNLQKFLVDDYDPMETEFFDSQESDGGLGETPGIDVLLRILTKYPKLQHLKILCFLSTTLEQACTVNPGRYAPPSLETLEIKASNTLSYSFLLRFPYLRRLHLHQGCMPQKQACQHKRHIATQLEAITFQSLFTFKNEGPSANFSGLYGVYSSNVWSILPNLKEIVVQRCKCRGQGKHYVYSRDGYNKSQAGDKNKPCYPAGATTLIKNLLK